MSTGQRPGSREWHDLVVEEVVDPEASIIDPHHHLWPEPGPRWKYQLDHLETDLDSGHHVLDTVFVECHSAYRTDGPDHLAPIGETEFVAGQAALSSRQLIGGIVAHADLRDRDRLDEVLDAHDEAAGGRLRGIRHGGAHALHPEALSIAGSAPVGLYLDPAFQAGVRRLGERGLTFDTWHYHYQNHDFAVLARSAPGTTLVLDHFGTPLGVGPYAAQREHIFAQWRSDMADIATIPNVVAKLGGLAMPDNGFGWEHAERPPTSDEFVEAQHRYYLHAIDQFGPSRCMFESNFPVDRASLSYRTLWNAFKKMAAPYSSEERDAMLRGTAARIYRL